MIITTADAPAAIGPYVQGVNLGAMTITSCRLIRWTAPCQAISPNRRGNHWRT
jgi:hypothetical protein